MAHFLVRTLGINRWWDRIDEFIVLGALPFSSDIPELNVLGIRAVVNTCAESAGPVEKYEKFGTRQLRIPTSDFTGPTLKDIVTAVEYIESYVRRGEVVYLHCMAGKSRSATVAICWLVLHRNMSPRAAQDHLNVTRPQVNKGIFRRRVVAEFERRRPE